METDMGGSASALPCVALRHYGHVYVGFANDCDSHGLKSWPKSKKVSRLFDIPEIILLFCASNQCVMGQSQKRKPKRRNYKYHAITFKLSAGQYRSLRNYCKARKTTPIKLIKRNLERFISNYEYEVPSELYLTENQLDLFSEN
jgi:hypothetical protein